jgi:hypothetical protein
MTGGDRHNGFGPRMPGTTRAFTRALELTRQAVSQQPAGASFGAAPPGTQQEICAKCGAAMPAARSRCRFCGGSAAEVSS